MTGLMAAAVACGVVLGCGAWLLLIRLPFMRPTTFVERIGPQLKSHNLESRLLRSRAEKHHPVRAAGTDPAPGHRRRRRVAGAAEPRLLSPGPPPGEGRERQVAGGFPGRTAPLGRGRLCRGGRCRRGSSVRPDGSSPLLAVVLVLGSAAGGFLLRDYLLGVQVRKREARMMAEFPSIAELMALAVSAGESATGALDRVCRSARGELSKDFTRVLAETRAGKPLVEALQEFSSRTELGPLLRFVDGLIVAVERGTPLADVLRAQAQDVRDTAKRELMESAGKKEIGMMVPVVFGVLPLTVVFAVFPGLAAISMGL